MRYIWKETPTSVFLFLLIILSSVSFRSRIKEWFRCSSQRFRRSTCQESRRTTAAGNTQHCREEAEQHTSPIGLGLVRLQHAKHMWQITTKTTSTAQLPARLSGTQQNNLFLTEHLHGLLPLLKFCYVYDDTVRGTKTSFRVKLLRI